MIIDTICTPGLVVAQLFPNARKEKGLTLATIKKAAQLNFYGAFELSEVSDPKERKDIQALAKERGLKLVYWLSLIQYEADVSISALDEKERLEAVRQLITELPNAFECGADYVGFLSGPELNPGRRGEAKKQLAKSINEMAQVTSKYGPMGFLMESMDREAHKKHIIGPTTEAVAFIHQVRETVPEFYFNLDAAHIKLLEEDPLDALSKALGVMSQIHLSNCVDDPTSPLFGDNHMPFGAPGFLTHDFIAGLFKKALDLKFMGPAKPIVSSEVLCKEGEDPWAYEKNCREIIVKACEQIERCV